MAALEKNVDLVEKKVMGYWGGSEERKGWGVRRRGRGDSVIVRARQKCGSKIIENYIRVLNSRKKLS